MKRNIGLSILFILLSCNIFWGSPQFITQVNSNKIGLNDVLQVSYHITNVQDFERISLPNISHFIQIGTQQRMFNNSDYEFVLTLKPTKTGTFIIPGATIKTTGNTYRSNNVEVTVINGSVLGNVQNRNYQNQNLEEDMQKLLEEFMGSTQDLDRQYEELIRRQRELFNELQRRRRNNLSTYEQNTNPSENFFIKASTDKTQIYVGEPITVTYKLYSRVAFDQGQISKLPSLKGFYSKDYNIPMPPEEVITNYNGRKYASFLIKKTYAYPTHTGVLALDEMEMQAITRNYGSTKITSQPVYIKVMPLPKHPSGQQISAVGQFNVTSKVEQTELTTNDIGTFVFTITGTGNLDLISSPEFKVNETLNMEAPHVTMKEHGVGESGSKIFTFNFAPTEVGDFEIPPVTFIYFDPSTNQYIERNTTPIQITVKEGSLLDIKNKSKSKSKAKLLAIDTKPLKISKPFIFENSLVYWSLLGLILASAPLLTYYRKRKDKIAENPELYTKHYTNKVAMQRLSKAHLLINNPNAALFYEEISKSINLYISDKLKLPLSDLSKSSIDEKLKALEIDTNTRNQTLDIIKECEMALYSGMGGVQQKETVLQFAISLITNLEEKLNTKNVV